jgi:DNA mismatch repair ATPase MutS
MFIDEITYQALNLGIIIQQIQPVSALGFRAKKSSQPFKNGGELQANAAYEKLTLLIIQLQKQPKAVPIIKETLQHIQDIGYILQKVQENAVLELYELQEVKQFLYFFIELAKQCHSFQLHTFLHEQKMNDLFSLLDPGEQNTPSFFLHDSYSEEFSLAKKEIEILQQNVTKEYNHLSEKAATILATKSLPGEIVVSRFQQELAKKMLKSDLFILKSENFANYCFALRKNDTIIKWEQKIDHLHSHLMILEAEIRAKLTNKITLALQELVASQNETGEFDWLLAKADFAIVYNCTIPKIVSTEHIHFTKGRNLPVEWELQKNHFSYQPISIVIDNHLNVLTGANMAGKTTLLKMFGQLLYLSAFAIPLPCHRASLPLVDFIFFSGLYEERMDLSSFGTEIVMLQEKLKQKGFGLYLIDEFARGTNPQEGEAISKAILDEFSEKHCLTIFSTHFQSPTTVKKAAHFQIVGLTETDIAALKKECQQALPERLKHLHQSMNFDVIKVDLQTEPPRAALLVAELLGIDKHIIEKAYYYLAEKE